MRNDDWYKAGELPPIGANVDVVGFVVYGIGEINCEVISYVENCAVIRMSYGFGCFESRNLKPSMTDRERFISTAIECSITRLNDLVNASEYLGIMYDAGFRLPESK